MIPTCYLFQTFFIKHQLPHFLYQPVIPLFFNKWIKSYKKYIPPLVNHGCYGFVSNNLTKALLFLPPSQITAFTV